MRKPYDIGYEVGQDAGTWFEITGDPQALLERISDCDPEVMDMAPAPLSGEWGGESLIELSGRLGINLEEEDVATEFEQGFSDGYWAEVEGACVRAQ